MLRGIGDPFGVLAYENTDSLIAQAIVAKANELHVKEWNSIIEAIGVAVANGVARAFGAR